MEEDTEEMKMEKSEMDQCWRILAERMEEEVLDKYKVEESKREAFRGRGPSLEWRRVRKNKEYRKRLWEEDCWARNFLFVERVQFAASTKQAGGDNGRRRDEAVSKNGY